MSLSEKQLEEMYKASLTCSTNLAHISQQLDQGGKTFGKHEERITHIEKEQAFLKGKIGAFVLFLTLCVTILLNGFGWTIAHLWTK